MTSGACELSFDESGGEESGGLLEGSEEACGWVWCGYETANPIHWIGIGWGYRSIEIVSAPGWFIGRV